MIPVTKPYLPEKAKYFDLLSEIWDRNYLTNQGPVAVELEAKIEEFLGCRPLQYVTNGTMALQLAIRALQLTGEIITTPYSYVATTSAILWEQCEPVFVDVLPNGNINPELLEQAISSKTSAILATHVYGVPCDVDAIHLIAKKYGLKVIYDAAHAFGVQYKGQSLYNFGDLSTASFHATKIFHTVEGGAIFSSSEELRKKISLLRAFGHINDNHYCLGINGKQSELHAAMGLSILPDFDDLKSERAKIFEVYLKNLSDCVQFVHAKIPNDVAYNYAYVPVLLPKSVNTEDFCKNCYAQGVNVRRYFYPSLNTLPYIHKRVSLKQAEELASRAICIPIFNGMSMDEVHKVIETIKACLKVS